jgi:hypothetical protein
MKLVGHALGQAVDARYGGLDAKTLPWAPNTSGGLKFFRSIIIFSSLILNAQSSPSRVQGSQYALLL